MVESGSTRPVIRLAAKVLLVDQKDQVLLFRGGDPASPESGTWWFPPGGGFESGETAQEAARREVLEETGLRVGDLGPIVYHRHAEFSFNGVDLVSEEDYFVLRVDHFDVSTHGWTDLEREVVKDHRWWLLADLRVTDEVVYPDELVRLVEEFS